MTRTFCFNLPDIPASSSNPSYLQPSSWQEACKLPLFPLLFSCECLIQAWKNSAPTNLSCCRESLPEDSHLGNVSMNTYGLDYPRIYFCCDAMLLWICSFLSCSAKKIKNLQVVPQRKEKRHGRKGLSWPIWRVMRVVEGTERNCGCEEAWREPKSMGRTYKSRTQVFFTVLWPKDTPR